MITSHDNVIATFNVLTFHVAGTKLCLFGSIRINFIDINMEHQDETRLNYFYEMHRYFLCCVMQYILFSSQQAENIHFVKACSMLFINTCRIQYNLSMPCIEASEVDSQISNQYNGRH